MLVRTTHKCPRSEQKNFKHYITDLLEQSANEVYETGFIRSHFVAAVRAWCDQQPVTDWAHPFIDKATSTLSVVGAPEKK